MNATSDDRLIAALGARQRRDDAEVFGTMRDPMPAMGAPDHVALLLTALDTMGEGLAIWDAQPRLIHCNARLAQLFGLLPGEIEPGVSAKDFLFLLIGRGMITMRAEEAEAWVETYIDASTRADRKQEVRLADGTWLSFDWRRLPVGGYVSVFSDITARRRAQSRLREAETKYRQIFDNVHEGVIQVTPEGRVLAVNRAGAAIFGYDSPEQMIASVTNAGEQLYADGARRAELLDQLEKHGFTRDFRSAMRQRDGTTIWVSKTLRRVDDDRGNMAMIEGMFRDISAQRRFEQALLSAKEQAEEANRAKSDFLANMSHELRTPLNAILGFAQIMVEELLGPIGNAKYADYSKDIVASGRHLLALINDILDMAKVEAGKMALEEEWFDLDDSVDAALLLVRERATANDLVLEKSLPSPPTVVWADLRRLRQVWINLLSNAVKFTQRGGRVRIEAVAEKDGSLTVTVSDTGIGIAAENLERVLQPFAQVANALSRGHEGTGLGLTLSKKMVELHGGGLMLESRLGAGTTVSVWLPADRCRHAGPPLPAPQPIEAASADLQHDFADSLARGEQAQPGSRPLKRKVRPEKRAPLAAD